MGKRADKREMMKAASPCCSRPDHPQVGDHVAIIRYEHGWFDGSISGTVLTVRHTNKTGGCAYTVKVDKDAEIFAGLVLEIGHRGDIKK